MRYGNLLGLLPVACAILLAALPGGALAQRARINKLADVTYGPITNFAIDQTKNQSICVFTTPLTTPYRVTATGSGASQAFTLTNGSSSMAYEVQWAASAGQTAGTSLISGIPLTNQSTVATRSGCSAGPVTSASLITILRSATVSAARSGNYTGTLTLLIAPN